MENKHKIKKLKSRYSLACLWGKCPNCSRVVDGKGIHDVEIYQIYQCEDITDCPECQGKGFNRVDCDWCEGTGTTEETCEVCKGKGNVPDEFGKKTFIGEKTILKEKVDVDEK